MTILIDTREKRPYDFNGMIGRCPAMLITVKCTHLKTGDYSIGCDSKDPADHITIERKSLSDLYSTLAQHRDRLLREFKRMADFGYAAIVVEATLDQIARPNLYLRHPTQMSAKSVIATLMAWSQRYGVHVWAFPGRQFAEKAVFRMLQRWQKDRATQGALPATSGVPRDDQK